MKLKIWSDIDHLHFFTVTPEVFFCFLVAIDYLVSELFLNFEGTEKKHFSV